MVGSGVGVGVGTGVGSEVGTKVGRGVGTKVGRGVGRGVGVGDGIGVGADEGSGVGAGVGYYNIFVFAERNGKNICLQKRKVEGEVRYSSMPDTPDRTRSIHSRCGLQQKGIYNIPEELAQGWGLVSALRLEEELVEELVQGWELALALELGQASAEELV